MRNVGKLPQTRDGRLSTLRVLATMMIVTIHISGMVSADWHNHYWAAGNLYNSASRDGVPIFLMITGALLLPRNDSLTDFLRKRVVRLLPPTAIWAMFYFWLGSVPVRLWPTYVLSARAEDFHLWYLYMVIGLSFGLPVIGAFFRTCCDRDVLIILLVWAALAVAAPFLAAAWPAMAAASSIVSFLQTIAGGLFNPYLGYVLLGAYLARRPSSRSAIAIGAALFLSCTIVITIATYLCSAAAQASSVLLYGYLTPLVALGAAGLFASIMACQIREGWLLKLVSDCCFGIYLVHLYGIRLAAGYGFNALGGSAWISIPETVAVVLAGSLAVIWLLRLTRVGRLIA